MRAVSGAAEQVSIHLGGSERRASENADSRVKAGIHFRFAANAGLEMGSRSGEQVCTTLAPRQPRA
jgi:hypothetical protein